MRNHNMEKFVKRIVIAVVLLVSLTANASQQLYYIHSDHLNTPQVLTDSNQKVVWKVEQQTPFGEVEIDQDPDGDSEDVVFNLRFPGQYFDEETNTNYNYYRTYDPSLGRFIQSDPIGILRDFSAPELQVAIGLGIYINAGISDMNANELYSYVSSNPIVAFDLYGLIECDHKLKVCRYKCRKRPHMSGACLEACEGKYGAMSDCADSPEVPKEPEDPIPEPDELTPNCTFEKWKAGECGSENQESNICPI